MGLAEDIIRAAQRGADEALLVVAHEIAESAKRKMPVGDPEEDPDPAVSMRENVNITPDPTGVIISVDVPYAAKQHEDLGMRHPRGGGSKFLEHALYEATPRMQGIVASDVEARMASGLKTDPRRPHR